MRRILYASHEQKIQNEFFVYVEIWVFCFSVYYGKLKMKVRWLINRQSHVVECSNFDFRFSLCLFSVSIFHCENIEIGISCCF